MSSPEKAKGFMGEFKAFIARGNVLDMAVGVIIGGAFGKISTSLVNDVIMPLISVLTGGFLGVIAAYYPKLDNIIMRCMDLFMAIPQMLLAMCIVTALGSSLFNLMLAVGLSSTPKFARVVRAAVMSTREQEFVEAARAIGASNTRIILHHILPNSISALIVQATLAMAGAIISASALSFLGFGIQAPMPEWGAMLSAGRKYIRTQAYLTVIPGLAIMVVVYALNVVGDGLRDCLDPRLKK